MKHNKLAWLIIAAGLFIAARQSLNIWKLWKSGEQVRIAQNQVKQAERENQQLRDRLAQIDNPEFIEKEARDKLGFAKEGETILVLPPVNQITQPTSPSDDRPSWKQWWDLYIRI